MYAHSEQWTIVLDNGQGNGKCTFNKQQDETITADGNWNYNYKGDMVYGPYTYAPVTIAGSYMTLTANGTATNPSAPPGYNRSRFTLRLNGMALNGQGEGTFTITFSTFGWPDKISGTWEGTRASGSGITAESKIMPWLFLLLKN